MCRGMEQKQLLAISCSTWLKSCVVAVLCRWLWLLFALRSRYFVLSRKPVELLSQSSEKVALRCTRRLADIEKALAEQPKKIAEYRVRHHCGSWSCALARAASVRPCACPSRQAVAHCPTPHAPSESSNAGWRRRSRAK